MNCRNSFHQIILKKATITTLFLLKNQRNNNTYTDRKNVTYFLYLVLHLACKVTFYFQLFSSVLVSVLRTSINVLSKSKSKNYVTWIANLTKLFLSVQCTKLRASFLLLLTLFQLLNALKFNHIYFFLLILLEDKDDLSTL